MSRWPLGAVVGASLLSVTCTAVSAIAVPWLVLTTTGSAARTGLAVAAEMAPYVVVQALAGPWVERHGPRRVSWAANVAAGAVLLVVPLLFLTGLLTFAGLVLTVAVVGALRGLADCGSAPLVPGAATHGGVTLERAAGLHSSAAQAGYLLGAPLAAVLLSTTSPPLVLLVSGVGMVLAGVLVGSAVPSRIGGGDERSGAAEPYLRQVAAGLRVLAGEPVVRAVVAMVAATNLVSAAFTSVVLPSWVREVGLPVAAVGTVAGALGLGALTGSLLGAWLAPRLDRWLVYAVGFLLGAAPLYLGLLVSDTLLPAAAVALWCGLASGGINPVIGAVQYERVPAAVLPRVLGTVRAIAWCGIPIGPVLVGLLVDGVGVRTTLAALGAVLLAATLLPFALPVFRGVRRPSDPVAAGGAPASS